MTVLAYPAVALVANGHTHGARPGAELVNGFAPAMCDRRLDVSVDHITDALPMRAIAEGGPEFDYDVSGSCPVADVPDCLKCRKAIAAWELNHPHGKPLTWESVRDDRGRRLVIYRRAMVDGRAVGSVSVKDETHCPDIARPWRAWGYPLDGRPPGKGNTNLGWYSVRQAAEKAVKRHAAGLPTPREDHA